MSTIIIKLSTIIKIFLLQIVFFILMFCIKFIFYPKNDIELERVFYTLSDLEVILEMILFFGLSFGMCIYILKSNKMICVSCLAGLSLCFLFEMSKYIEYLLGFLPNYGDVPIIASILLSLIATSLYMGILYLMCLLWKKIRPLFKNKNQGISRN
ncbi:hypothetical protein LJB78_00640 [Bacteroidales bacterium OttesenSCG-928-J16]|nr:hypothetical protein [Bacteroidales bacterium OttesenSCG-928-J16]